MTTVKAAPKFRAIHARLVHLLLVATAIVAGSLFYFDVIGFFYFLITI